MTTRTIDDATVTALRLRLRGEVLVPGDAGYDEARKVHNLAVEKTPAFIAKAADASDVIRALNFARRHDLPLAVRSGGHSIPGYSVNDGGLVIDLGSMNEVSIDPVKRVAHVQAGATAGDVADAAQKLGFAVPMGDAPTVGVGGITLGGGIGYLTRKHGLTIDNLLGVELVTADGRIVNASENENPELFWALRGGGGNFGIVTAFTYRIVEVGTIVGGAIILEATEEALTRFAEFGHNAPRELGMIANVTIAPPLPFIPADKVGTPVILVATCYNGDLDEGEKVVAPLRHMGNVVADLLGRVPYTMLYDLIRDAAQPIRNEVRSNFLPRWDSEMSATVMRYMNSTPFPRTLVQLRPIGNGAMSDVDVSATAFSHRGANYLFAVIGMWEEGASDEAGRAWVQAFYNEFAAKGEGVYSNFLGMEGEERIRSAYVAQTFDRLAALKAEFDPENVFSGNQNIAPVRRAVAA